MSNRPPYPKGDPRARVAGRKGGQITAIARRASRTPYSGNIIDLMDAAGMVGEDWAAWRVFWKACYGLPMTDEELHVFQRHTHRETPPSAPVSEAWMCVGRRGGKSANAALGAFFQGISTDRRQYAKPKEVVTIPLLARDRKQSRILLGHLRSLAALPAFRPYVHRAELKETIELTTGVDIEIGTASRSGTRGYTSPAVVCDEVAHWLDEGSNPADEILDALRPTMGTVPGALLLALSNPHAPRGPLFEAVEQYHGVDDPDVLVWVADTVSMHPSYDRRVIERAYRRDPVVAASEYGADGAVQFRQHSQALFDAEPVNAAIISGRRELPPMRGTRYVAFLDAAQGSRSGDSMTLAVAHREGSRAVLDLLREAVPPFNPAAVLVETFAPILGNYGIREVMGDRVSIGFVGETFANCGIKFIPSPLSKSELYGELLPAINTGAVELLDHPTLRTQLLSLQRRSVRSGRDSIDAPKGGHDDLSNVVAGAAVVALGIGGKKKRPVMFSGCERADTQRDAHAELRELIRATRERAEREAQRDWERARAAEDAPMRSTPVWHVHRT